MVKLNNNIELELNYFTPPKLMEFAARFSTLSHHLMTENSHEKFLHNLETMGHNSPKKCSLVVITAKNIDRALTHQIVVHGKIIDKSQESQRYVKQSKSEFYEHPDIDHQKNYKLPIIRSEELTEEIDINVGQLYELCRKMYTKLLLDGKKKEVARRILPNSVGQTICLWGSVPSWQSFCMARMSLEAETPIRTLACGTYDILKNVYPNLFNHEKYQKKRLVAEKSGLYPMSTSYKNYLDYIGYKHEKRM
jgi:flavin-dependent thymidylate synthase